jgi:phosphoglucosamine mutase
MPSFGTDGVRGIANTEIPASYALALGRAAARVLGGGRVVIGRDTRRSGYLLEAALAAGFATEGVDVELLGVLPTPAIALIAAHDGVPAAVITASHNPFADNGIKLFAAGGRKLPDDVEARIEAELAALAEPTRVGVDVGTISVALGAGDRYAEAAAKVAGPGSLAGVRIVLDCANGATSYVAEQIFATAGATVTVIANQPDGININAECGATHPQPLAAAVVAAGADLGLAFDGDGDRLIAVDHRGQIVDGDRIIALLAVDLRAQNRLADNTVVVTVMSNLGFHRAMAAAGITVRTTAVGDRYVLEMLASEGLSLGGEQSGHIIVSELATTGDGILAGLLLADLVTRAKRPLAELADASMQVFPQVLVNVRVAERNPQIAALIAEDIAAVERGLGGDGRVLIRASGTEPLIRVMVEAPTAELAKSAADGLADTVRARFG